MSILKDIEKIKEKTFVLAVFDILFLISPGLMAIWLFRGDLFFQLDWIKLVLLSIAITAPFASVNTFLFMGLDDKSKIQKKGDLFLNFSLSILATGFVIYCFSMVGYLLNTPLRTIIWIFIVIEVILTLWASYKDYIKGKNEKGK